MARRRTIMGLPVGKKKSAIPRKALVAAGAGLAAVPAAVAASRRVGDAVSSGVKTVHQIQDVGETASNIKEAVSGHSSTIGKIGAVVGEVRKLGGDGNGKPKLSHLIEEHIDVAVPRSVAYNQWTQFEMFPSIVKGAERVEQKERDKAEWTSKIGPSRRSWSSEITEQVPDERIAWKTTGGLQMKGVVTFHSLDDNLTRVHVQIEYTPRGPVEHVANLLRIQRRRVRRDLRLFKHFVELRGEATGAWRSRIAKKDERGHDRGSRRQGTGTRAGRKDGHSSNGSGTGHRRTASSGDSRRTSGKSAGSRASSSGRRSSSGGGRSGSS